MEKYTKEQLNAMDKEALIQLLYNTQQLLETLVKQNQELTETIALMNQRQFGRERRKARRGLISLSGNRRSARFG